MSGESFKPSKQEGQKAEHNALTTVNGAKERAVGQTLTLANHESATFQVQIQMMENSVQSRNGIIVLQLVFSLKNKRILVTVVNNQF